MASFVIRTADSSAASFAVSIGVVNATAMSSRDTASLVGANSTAGAGDELADVAEAIDVDAASVADDDDAGATDAIAADAPSTAEVVPACAASVIVNCAATATA